MTTRMTVPAWLSDGEVLLHIGVYKTGTTSVQDMLAPRRADLTALGVSYPGRHVAHNSAAMAVLGVRRGWKNGGRVPERINWDKLVAQSQRADSRTIVSSEVFCLADDDHADQIVSALGRGRTKVLITLRPLEELIPSSWQEYVKSGLRIPYPEWVDRILLGPGAVGTDAPSFWSRNDFGPLVERWARVAGPENVTVLTIDRSRPGFLYEEFETLVGLPTGFLTPDPDVVSNRSMSAAEVEVFRALNDRVRDVIPFERHRRLVRDAAVRHLVTGRRPAPDEPRLAMSADAVRRARDLHADVPARIRATGVRIVGDVDALAPTGEPVDADMTMPTHVPIEAVVMMLEGIMTEARVESEMPASRPAAATTTHRAKDALRPWKARAYGWVAALRRRRRR